MSFWYYTPEDEATVENPATGQAGLGEIYSAASEQAKLVENSTAAGEALTRAYDARIKAIKDATGEETSNPMRVDLRTGTFEAKPNPQYTNQTGLEPRQAKIDAAVSGFNTWLSDVAKRHPEQAAIIAPDRPVEKDATELAKHADETLAKAMASRDGVAKWLAAFAGGGVGSLSDPLQVVGMMVGGGAGTARTAAGRILTTTMTEAAANAAVEAVMQPQVQAWRKQVGLPNGINEAIQNVAFAGLFGGAVGGAGGAAAEGLRVLSRLREAAPEDIARVVASTHDVQPALRAAIDGDAGKAAELLSPVRDALPAETRGALDALSADRTFAQAAPVSAAPLTHETNLNRAIQSSIDNQPWTPEVDMAQVARIADQLQPETKAMPASGQTLQQFLVKQGGVQDYKGELAAIGLTNASERFSGRLVRDTGLTLDNARLAAAEAGYFNHLYGTPDLAAERSTIRDLLDTLDTSNRAAPAAEGNARAHLENLVHDLVAHAGPGIDDASVMRAAELTVSEGLPPTEAMDRVLIAKDQSTYGVMPPKATGYSLELDRIATDAVADGSQFQMLNLDGKHIATAVVKLEGNRLLVDRMWAADSYGKDSFNTLGPSSMRRFAALLAQEYPKAQSIEGLRVGGARHGGEYIGDAAGGLNASLNLQSIRNAEALRNAREMAANRNLPSDSKRGGLDDPATPIEDTFFTDADLEGLNKTTDIPFFEDGGTVKAGDLMDELQHYDDLTALVEACRA